MSRDDAHRGATTAGSAAETLPRTVPALAAPDPRVQVALLVTLSVAVFAAHSWRGVAVGACVLVVLLVVASVPVSTLARGLRPTAVVLAFALLANAVVLTAGGPRLSHAGALRGALAVARIVIVVGYAEVAASSVTAEQVAGALSWSIRPLGRLGLPVGDVSLATTVALRFVPVVSDELRRVTAAQRSRGARVNEGSLGERLGQWGRVLVPVVVGLFRRSDELAQALYDRCYGQGAATSLLPRPTRRDALALAAGLAVSLVVWLA